MSRTRFSTTTIKTVSAMYVAGIVRAGMHVSVWPESIAFGRFSCHGQTCDNCPATNNGGQRDTDHDGVGDRCDNCVLVFNPDQNRTTTSQFGDAYVCDSITAIVPHHPDFALTACASTPAAGATLLSHSRRQFRRQSRRPLGAACPAHRRHPYHPPLPCRSRCQRQAPSRCQVPAHHPGTVYVELGMWCGCNAACVLQVTLPCVRRILPMRLLSVGRLLTV
jgi:hypothetical protein